MSLNSSEKLNAVHSNLRDFCQSVAKHKFFTDTVSISNTRFAHFDIAAKVATIEIEGLDTGLRLEDVKQVFVANASFSSNGAVARGSGQLLTCFTIPLLAKPRCCELEPLFNRSLHLAAKSLEPVDRMVSRLT